MSSHDGIPGVVLFDEFEKAEDSLGDALLNIWDRGEWEDKKLDEEGSQTKTIDCSRMCFVLTTNAFDNDISKFERENPGLRFQSPTSEVEQRTDKILRTKAQKRFSPSFAGRISAFVPFLSFAQGEAIEEQEVQVLVDKAMQKTFDFHSDSEANGHTSITVFAPAKTCGDFVTLAQTFFSKEEGMRSVTRCMERYISDIIVNMWAQGDLDQNESYVRFFCDLEHRRHLSGLCPHKLSR